jgi:carboxylesterase
MPFWPLSIKHLVSRPHPAASYDEALLRLEALRAAEPDTLNPLCRTAFMTHGRRSKRVAVLFHGYTNCPRQFERLGGMLFERGYNVLLPRLPHHGLANRLSADLARLTAEELVQCGDTLVDIAAGLGERIVVGGISAGGVLCAWLAQQRSDVARALVLAPAFGYAGASPWLTLPILSLALVLPNMFVWWDRELKDARIGPPHAYPRFATRSLGQVFRLGWAVLRAARRAPPAARSAVVVTIGGDPAVQNGLAARLVSYWQRWDSAGKIGSYEFDISQSLIHDIIDPEQARQQIERVYPVLLGLIEQ